MSEISREALSRARFFFNKAKDCGISQRDDFEAYLDASIVFAQSAFYRAQYTYDRHPDFDIWWQSIKENHAFAFFLKQRNFIVHRKPSTIGQVIGFNNQSIYTNAYQLYFYEKDYSGNPISIIKTIDDYLSEAEKALVIAYNKFKPNI